MKADQRQRRPWLGADALPVVDKGKLVGAGTSADTT